MPEQQWSRMAAARCCPATACVHCSQPHTPTYPPALGCHSPLPLTRELFRVYSNRCCNVARSSLASLYKTKASPAPSCPLMCGALTVHTGSVRSSASSCMEANTHTDQHVGIAAGGICHVSASDTPHRRNCNSTARRAAAAAAAAPRLYTLQTCSTPFHVDSVPSISLCCTTYH